MDLTLKICLQFPMEHERIILMCLCDVERSLLLYIVDCLLNTCEFIAVVHFKMGERCYC